MTNTWAEDRRKERQEFLETFPPTSIYGQISKLPVLIKEYPMGFIVYLPRTGLTVVPFENTGDGHWNCAVVKGNQTYPVGGYHLCISHDEIERGVRVDI